MKPSDPADNPPILVRLERMDAQVCASSLDAAADGAFGGKQQQPTNRRAGYSKTITFEGREYTEIEWIKRTAMRDGTLASSEGRKLVEHYERILDRLRQPSETMSDAFIRGYIASDDGETFSHRRHIQAGFRAAVAIAEQEASDDQR